MSTVHSAIALGSYDAGTEFEPRLRLVPSLALFVSSIFPPFQDSLLLSFYLFCLPSNVTSVVLYGCETWTLLADFEKGSGISGLNARGNFSASPTPSTRLTTGC